jgi:hemoglobin/transferrin/lactoferrin receptor protein
MKSLLLTGSAAFVLSMATASAQTAAAPAPKGAEAMETVTVYGSRNPRAALSFPGMVSVLNPEEIALRQSSTISDLLRDVPSVEFAGGPRRTGETPSIRGLGGQRVLILIDGVRQSFTSAHDGRFFLDPSLLQTAEVVRGASSALYGSGALGGVLGFRTVDARDLLGPGESQGMRLRAAWASGNEESLGALTGYAVAGGVALLAGIGQRRSGDIKLGDGRSLRSEDDIVTGLVKADYLAPDWSAALSYQSFRNDSIEPNNGQGIGSTDPVLAQVLDKRIDSEQIRGELTWRPDGSNWIDLTIVPYRVETFVDERERVSPRRTLRDVITTGLTIENRSRFSFGESFAGLVTLGYEHYADEQTGRDNATGVGTREGVPDGKTRFDGAFLQVEASWRAPLGLPGELVLIPGVRFERFESSAAGQVTVSEDATAWKFAASYSPLDWFTVFGSWSEGFRAPSINELYLSGVHFRLNHPILGRRVPPVTIANFFVPNPNLKPEKAENIEAGIALDFTDLAIPGDRLTFKAAFWQADVLDLIDLSVSFAFDASCFRAPVFLPCTAGTTNAANIATATLKGFEAELVYDAPRLRLALAYGDTTGRNAATGAFLGTLTPARFSADARLKLPEIDAGLGVRLQSAADFDRVNRAAERRDGYAVADLYAFWAPDEGALKGLRLDVAVENVTDRAYERVFAGVPEPGRNVKLGISYSLAW